MELVLRCLVAVHTTRRTARSSRRRHLPPPARKRQARWQVLTHLTAGTVGELVRRCTVVVHTIRRVVPSSRRRLWPPPPPVSGAQEGPRRSRALTHPTAGIAGQ